MSEKLLIFNIILSKFKHLTLRPIQTRSVFGVHVINRRLQVLILNIYLFIRIIDIVSCNLFYNLVLSIKILFLKIFEFIAIRIFYPYLFSFGLANPFSSLLRLYRSDLVFYLKVNRSLMIKPIVFFFFLICLVVFFFI